MWRARALPRSVSVGLVGLLLTATGGPAAAAPSGAPGAAGSGPTASGATEASSAPEARPPSRPVAVNDALTVEAGGSAVLDVLANDRAVRGLRLDVLSAPAGVDVDVVAGPRLRIHLDPATAPPSAWLTYRLTQQGEEVARARVLVTRAPAEEPVAGRPAESGADGDEDEADEAGTGDAVGSPDEPTTAVPADSEGAGQVPPTEPGEVDDGAESAEPHLAGAVGDTASAHAGDTGSGSGGSPALPGRHRAAPPAGSTPERSGQRATGTTAGTGGGGSDAGAGSSGGAALPGTGFGFDLVPPLVALAPPAQNRAVVTHPGLPVVVDVLGARGDRLEVVGVGEAAHGQVDRGDGVITYVPDPGFTGTDSFSYTARDGGPVTQTTVTVTVVPVRLAPVAVDDTAVTGLDESVTVAVLANDRNTLFGTLEVVDGPTNGTARVDGPVVEYDPPPGFTGGDEFRYRVTTPYGPAEATVAVQVVPAATAVADVATTGAGEDLEVDVRRNDVGAQDLRVLLLDSLPDGSGAVAVTGDGRVRYSPPDDLGNLEELVVTLRYALAVDSEARHVLDSTTLRIRVTAEPLDRVAVDDAFVFPASAAGQPLVLDVLANDRRESDEVRPVPGKPLCPQGQRCDVDADPSGQLTLTAPDLRPGDRVFFRYALALFGDEFPPEADVVVRIQDEQEVRARAVADRARAVEGDRVRVPVLANDIVPPGYTVEVVDGEFEGEYSLDDGVLTYWAPVDVGSSEQTFRYRLVPPAVIGIAAVGGSEAGVAPEATVTVVVEDAEAVDDRAVVDYGTAPERVGVLDNDRAPVGAEVRLVQEPTRGSVEELGDAFRYEPDDLPAGTDTFTYEMVLPSEDSDDDPVVLDTASVTVEVRRALARPDRVDAVPGLPTPVQVLANDYGVAGRSVEVPEDGQPDSGSVTVDEDGVVTYTMDSAFRGDGDSFDYEVGIWEYVSPDYEFRPESRATVTVRRIPEPDAPVVTAEPGNSSATVRWTLPAATGGLAVTAYRLTWAPVGQAPQPGDRVDLAASATRAEITGLRNGTTYALRLSAVSAAGEGQPGTVEVTPRTVPGAPEALTAVAGAGLVLLDWQPPSADGGAPVTQYRVTWRPVAGSGPSGSTVLPASARQAAVDGLPDGLALRFAVSARNAAGEGSAATITAEPGRELDSLVGYTTADGEVLLDVVPGEAAAGLALVVDPASRGTAAVVPPDGLSYVPGGPFERVELGYRLLAGAVELARGESVVLEVRAVNDAASSPRGLPVSVDLLANDLAPEGVGLDLGAATGGTVAPDGAGGALFTPDEGFVGAATFGYDLRAPLPGGGTGVVDSAEVRVEVGPRPDAADDDATTRANEPVAIPVLANDVAADGLDVEVQELPEGAEAAVSGGVVTFRPPASSSGLLAFDYALTDGAEEYDVATVRVQVEPLPLLVDDAAETPAETAVTVPVLANDVDAAGLDVVLVPPRADAAVVGQDVRYTPPASVSGTTVVLRYGVVEDGDLLGTALVRVTVGAAPQGPGGGGSGGGGSGGGGSGTGSGGDGAGDGASDGTTEPEPEEPPGGAFETEEPSGEPPAADPVLPQEDLILTLDVPSTVPGGAVTLSGAGCRAGAPVAVRVDGELVSTLPAGPDGAFAGAVLAPSEVGRHEVVATCDERTFRSDLDVVLPMTQASAATPVGGALVAVLLAFYVLAGSVLSPRGTAVDDPAQPAL